MILGDSQLSIQDIFKKKKKSPQTNKKKINTPIERKTQMANKHENMLNFQSDKINTNWRNSETPSHTYPIRKRDKTRFEKNARTLYPSFFAVGVSTSRLSHFADQTGNLWWCWCDALSLGHSMYREICLRKSLRCTRIFTASWLEITKRCPLLRLWIG